MASERLARVSALSRPGSAEINFDFLSKVLGAVKNVITMPQEGISVSLERGNVHIPVFRFADILRSDEPGTVYEDVYKAVLCAFVGLRPEVPGLWSPISGLTRLDVPAPAMLDGDRRSTWIQDVVDQDGGPGLRPSELEKLKGLIGGYISLRWPLPTAFGNRTFTELYAIAETERWANRQLLHPYELRRQLTQIPPASRPEAAPVYRVA